MFFIFQEKPTKIHSYCRCFGAIAGGRVLWWQKMVQDERVRPGGFPEVVKTTKVDDETAD